ncbi:MAG: helix-turn-helix domain-containing protein [Spirochaetaceae bacterium]|nr:helix-turn-helix domain-containing protein [Spirochaetaceae bacterium]
MESLGEKFKIAREQRGFTIDQVARDTHIAKRYIAALEEENFEQFPGDTYIMGFLRNYADYLGMESAELANLYRNMKIQEQPIPIEELLQKKSSMPLVFAVAGIVLLLGLAAGGYFLFLRDRLGEAQPETPRIEKTEAPVSSAALPVQYTMDEEAVEQAFGEGDELIVRRGETSYTLKIERIESTVLLLTPEENMNLQEGEETYIRLSPQGETLKVICRGIQKAEPPRAVLFFDKYLQSPATAAAQSAPESTAAIGSTNEPSRVKRTQVIMEASSPQPFTIETEFRGYCLFRYVTDSQTREERYFRRGETFRTDLRREIRLWYSNAGSLRARISGNEIEFGKPGEVGAAVIRWTQAGARSYRLELIPMY